MPEADHIGIEIAYALSDSQLVLSLTMPSGSTVSEAIEASGIVQRLKVKKLDFCGTGVFGKVCKPDYVLCEGDRIELYRPLVMDPKQQRRQRALKPKQG